MDNNERIKAKRKELLEIFQDLNENELKIAAGLIDQAAFLSVTLEDLAEDISENGTIEEYTNGANQSGRKISSNAKLYSSLIAKYTAITTKLLKIAPKVKEKSAAEIYLEERARKEEARKEEQRRKAEQWKKDHSCSIDNSRTN